MRTGVFEQFGEPTPEWLEMMKGRDEANPSFITASGFGPSTSRVSSTPSLTSTFTSKIESWSLNLSSRDARRLNISYVVFMALSCIAFFTSHWSIFLAFLIPALITMYLRVARRVLKTASHCPSGPSTSGT